MNIIEQNIQIVCFVDVSNVLIEVHTGISVGDVRS